MLGMMLCIMYPLSRLIFKAILGSIYYYGSYFADMQKLSKEFPKFSYTVLLLYNTKLDMNVHTSLFTAAKPFTDLKAHSQNHQAQGLPCIHKSIFGSFLMHG